MSDLYLFQVRPHFAHKSDVDFTRRGNFTYIDLGGVNPRNSVIVMWKPQIEIINEQQNHFTYFPPPKID